MQTRKEKKLPVDTWERSEINENMQLQKINDKDKNEGKMAIVSPH